MMSDELARCSAIWNGCKCGRGPHQDDRHVWLNSLDGWRAVDPARYPALAARPDSPTHCQGCGGYEGRGHDAACPGLAVEAPERPDDSWYDAVHQEFVAPAGKESSDSLR